VTVAGHIALSIGSLLIGTALGFLLGRLAARRGRRPPAGLTIADLVSRVIGSSHNGAVVLNQFGDVVLHNPRAVELGVVRNQRVDPRAAKAAELVRENGEVVTVDLAPLERVGGRGPEAVLGEVRPLGDGFTVVDAADESDAVRLEATRRDFVANVSHELKTPVGALALLAEAILDAADDPDEVRRFSGKILHEATRLGTLVTELIALSRLQGAERLPELTTVDVDEVVSEALGRSRVVAERTEVEIATDSPSELQVEGDQMLLVTALGNLIENAIAYSPNGSPVSVSRRLVDGFVEIAVTDRGIGIAPEHQQRVFERFFRVDPARSRVTGGTGLGLAIVKHVAANHGGEVRLWSQPGTGSTFTLRLPARGSGGQVDVPEQAGHGERGRVIKPSPNGADGQVGGAGSTGAVPESNGVPYADHGGVL
jgi:two-component system sensor histidine kinase SenX3